VCLVLGTGQAVSAETLVDNGDPTWGYGVSILSELDTFNQVGDDFLLDTSVVLQQVEWWGSASGNDFVARIHAFDEDTPEILPLLDHVIGILAGEEVEFSGPATMHYLASIPPLALPAGRYLLSIVDQSSDETWFWDASCEDGCEGGSWRRPLDGDAWALGNFAMAFRLHGAMDAPSASPDLPIPVTRLRNIPNPFNPSTTIRFSLTRASTTQLSVFDMHGHLVRRLLRSHLVAGDHAVAWDGRNDDQRAVESGVYLYRLEIDGNVLTQKMTLLK
jgi:hypothetical protein